MLRYTGTLTDSLPVPDHRVKLSSDKIRLIVRLLIQEPQQLTEKIPKTQVSDGKVPVRLLMTRSTEVRRIVSDVKLLRLSGDIASFC